MLTITSTATATTGPVNVAFGRLVAEPESYNNELVKVEGYYLPTSDIDGSTV
jgi:hypothetical protein